ncbi:MAG: HAMP domain-containing histidine kinase [Deltaproteobacteria bacterium]|nr:HAMP domain-containing histidine kinase [Deltaproteobacteria bacterium]
MPHEHASCSSRAGRDSSGLGLGLYITQQIVLAHRGRIRVESDERAGTRFVIVLPRAVASSEHVFGAEAS